MKFIKFALKKLSAVGVELVKCIALVFIVMYLVAALPFLAPMFLIVEGYGLWSAFLYYLPLLSVVTFFWWVEFKGY